MKRGLFHNYTGIIHYQVFNSPRKNTHTKCTFYEIHMEKALEHQESAPKCTLTLSTRYIDFKGYVRKIKMDP